MAKRMAYFVMQGAPAEMEFGASWQGRWEPRADIYQTADAIHIQIEAPGLDETNLSLEYDPQPGQLIVEGRRDRAGLPGANLLQAARCLQVEIEYGPFRRAVPLPPDIDSSGIAATYQAGLLLITVPRKKPSAAVNLRVHIK